jgi:two-component system nitrogen regulation response regulator GlnG
MSTPQVSTLVVVDDEEAVRYSFSRMMAKDPLDSFKLETFASGKQCLDRIRLGGVSVVVLDVRLGGEMDGAETLRRIKEMDPKISVILMTAYASANTAIEATRHGAYDYVLKPFEPTAMRELIHRACQAHEAMSTAVVLGDDDALVEGDCIIGRSPAMQEVYKKIGRVANSTEPVLIRGESGTGKELVARALYQFSHRKNAVFLPINCGAIPENLLESEFFGHERGSFTGAHERRIGKFEQADGGTVFLDEIGEMPLETQVKLLRFLEDKMVTRVGATGGKRVDVRILAATNRPLEECVAEQKFRGDLYFRLNVVSIDLPPLRERREDIPLLARYFLRRHARINGIDPPLILPSAIRALEEYDWPGNARELENTIRRVLVQSRGHAISPEDLGLGELSPGVSGDANLSIGGASLESHLSVLLKKSQEELVSTGNCSPVLPVIERVLVTEALQLTRGNQVQASKILGMSRNTLRKRIQETVGETE